MLTKQLLNRTSNMTFILLWQLRSNHAGEEILAVLGLNRLMRSNKAKATTSESFF